MVYVTCLHCYMATGLHTYQHTLLPGYACLPEGLTTMLFYDMLPYHNEKGGLYTMEKSVNVQTRLNICTLASLARAYSAEGAFVKSRSDLVWKAVEQVMNLYESKGAVRFTDVYDALSYLDSVGLHLDTSKRTRRQVQSAMVGQNAESDFGLENFGPRVTKRQLLESARSSAEEALSDDPTVAYRGQSALMENAGLQVLPYDVWKERWDASHFDSTKEPAVQETVDVREFERREEEKRKELRDALSTTPTIVHELGPA